MFLRNKCPVFDKIKQFCCFRKNVKHRSLADTAKVNVAIQQDDNYKKFMDTITSGGLRHAVAVYNRRHSCDYNFQQIVSPAMRRDVIVVGAGVAGLSAAYELAQIGHNVSIIEAQDRVGGRVKTVRKPFADGLHCEAGAMRLPPNHYLTKHYVDLFKIKTRKFQNYQARGFLYIYGERITMEEWTDDNQFWSTHWWPGWNANLSEENKASINGILDLYDRTMAPVKNELGTNPTKADWQKWFQKWSKVSFGQFLRFAEINPTDDGGLRPWPEAAITAYTTSTYTPTLGDDLASTLREDLGGWWRDDLYTPVVGMDTIPNGFLASNQYGWNKEVCLSKNIVYDVKVSGVEEFPSQANGRNDRVRVKGVNTKTGKPYNAEGHAVILTVTLPILRQLDVPLSTEKQKAMADITYGASTKILLQCKTRFWQKECGQGGFSKTNLVIGQLHYPDYDQSGIPDSAPGILLVYTWAENATILAAQPEEMAIESALDEISKIHPEIRDEFEVGYVQAWSTDQYSQGAYAQLKPFEYLDSLDKLTTSTDTIYLAGEALSWTNGWQQGAFFSALAQAFAFENKLENGKAPMYRPFIKLI